jgi:hypothetical protein
MDLGRILAISSPNLTMSVFPVLLGLPPLQNAPASRGSVPLVLSEMVHQDATSGDQR